MGTLVGGPQDGGIRLDQAEEVLGEVVSRHMPYFDQDGADQIIEALAGDLKLGDARLGWMLAAVCWWVRERYRGTAGAREWCAQHRLPASTFCEHANTFEAYYPGECAFRRAVAAGERMSKREFERRRQEALYQSQRVAGAPYWMHLAARNVPEPERTALLGEAQRSGYSRDKLRRECASFNRRPYRRLNTDLVAQAARYLGSANAAAYLDAVVAATQAAGLLAELHGRVVLASMNLSDAPEGSNDEQSG